MKQIMIWLYRFYATISVYCSYYCCYFYFQFLPNKKRSYSYKYVIGTTEIGNNIYSIGKILKDTYTVCLLQNRYYTRNEYNFQIPSGGWKSLLYARLLGPILLGFLANCSEYFLYTWELGFCDIERDIDFSFLRKKNKKIICIFVGDDVRSIKKTADFWSKTNVDHWSFYLMAGNNFFASDEYERKKMRTAAIADQYADVILTTEDCNTSYLRKPPLTELQHSNKKYPIGNIGVPVIQEFVEKYRKPRTTSHLGEKSSPTSIKVIHAASSPIVKGTPLVRAAVRSLKEKGYQFEYVEAFTLKNEQLIELLHSADILLCQFYESFPGLLGIEGLLAGTAVLTSAPLSCHIPEEDLSQFQMTPPWFITASWQIYDHLKLLLDNPEKIQFYKDNAALYVERYCNLEYQQKRLVNLIHAKNVNELQ